MKKLDFWFEFASPYSYLAAVRIGDLCAAKGVKVEWHPFLLGPIFQEQGWNTSPFNIYEAKGVYMWRDMERETTKLNLPAFVRPDPFPQNGLLAARIATMGPSEPWGPKFIQSVFHAQFACGLTISNDDVLGSILEGLGLSARDLIEQAQTDEQVKLALRSATDKAASLGLFGAPSFVTGDKEVFWGNDRLLDAIDWESGRNE